MHCATVSLIAACLTSSGLALGATIPPGDTRNAQLGPVEGLVLDDQQGRVEIEARDIPLGALLKALAAQASVEARLAEPSLASCSVNAKRQQAASLREAIERLLQGFSYALYPAASGALALTIVAACPPAQPAHAPAATGSKPSPQLAAKIPIVETSPPAPPDQDEAPEMGAPHSLDEFEPLAAEEPLHDREEDQREVDPNEQGEQAYQDAVVSRALKALHSPHDHLKEDAIGSLAGIPNPEVTQVLIETASAKLGLPMEARTKAVALLWENATQPGSSDPAVLSAHEQLAKDVDPAVSSHAENALKDLQQRTLTGAAPAP